MVAKDTEMRVGNNYRQPSYLPKNRQSDRLKAKLNILFLKGMLKKVRC
jgi:hypothetical protein